MNQQLNDMQAPAEPCEDGNCPEHFHADELIFSKTESRQRPRLLEEPSSSSEGHASNSTDATIENENGNEPAVELYCDPDDHGFRRIIRNFTPSYVCRL